MSATRRIGIDLGGTKTRLALVDADGTVLANASRPTAEYGSGTAAAIALAFDVRNLAGGQDPVFIGVGASGPVLADGTIANPDTLPGFSGFDLAEHLRIALDVPCRVDNDALAAALGEWHHGAGRGARRLLMVTLGTGIGVAVVSSTGEPYVGTDGIAPEAGHISVPGEGHPCYCGLANCWEQVASRSALQRLAVEADAGAAPSDPQRAVARLVATGDPHGVFEAYGRGIALGLATLLTVHRPDVVVFGGSGAEHLDRIEPGVLAGLAGRPAYYAPHTLRSAALGDLGGAIGATCLSSTSTSEGTR
ncbi:MAG: ROK family protein [Actinobacteria bacterium]|nr:ROK family protein [Actinomycetota bacterium]